MSTSSGPAPSATPPPPHAPTAAHTNAAPARVLGLGDATGVVVGAIIGVGIFFNPSTIARVTGSGPLALTAWILAGAIALCGALVFAELGGRYHASGAQYEVLRDSCGPLPAFLFVFCNATGTQACAIGIIALVCAEHVVTATGSPPVSGQWLVGLASAMIVLLALANIAGVRWGSRIQNFTALCKVMTLFIIAGIAAFVAPARDAATDAEAARSLTPLSPVAGLLAGLVPAFFAYGGWQQALWISGEVRRPQRNVPRAIVIGVLVVIAAYVLVNWGYLRLLGVEGVASSKVLAADAVATVYPAFGGRIVAAAVAISAFGVLNSQLLSGPRLIYGMARDGRFFAIFGRLHERFKTPVAAIVLLAAPAIGLIAAAGRDRVDYLLTGAVFIDAVFFILTAASVFVLRRRHAAAPATATAELPFRMPLYPLVPILFILGQLGGMVGSFLNDTVRGASYIGALWIGVGVLLYFGVFHRRAGTHAR